MRVSATKHIQVLVLDYIAQHADGVGAALRRYIFKVTGMKKRIYWQAVKLRLSLCLHLKIRFLHKIVVIPRAYSLQNRRIFFSICRKNLRFILRAALNR